MLAYIKDILYLCSVNERQQHLKFNPLKSKVMMYEVKFHIQRNGVTYRQTFENYSNAWRYGQLLEKRNIHYIINPVNN